jgi:hypothetical protein
MSEGRKFLKQAAMQIGAGGSAGRHKKQIYIHSHFIYTFSYKFMNSYRARYISF